MSYLEDLALAWAERDGLESWTLAAPDARPVSPAILRDIVADYLAQHEPFPDGTSVMTRGLVNDGMEHAVIVGRPGNDEWTVAFDDGREAWRDGRELQPAR